MNKDQADGKWEQIKGRAKKAWGELTDDDFLKAEGSVDRLYGVIHEKVGDSKDTIRSRLEESQDKLHKAADDVRDQVGDGGHGDGSWLKVKGRAKRAWGELTDDEKLKSEGTADKVHGAMRAGVVEVEAAVKTAIERVKPD